MEKITKVIREKAPKSISDYINLYRQLGNAAKKANGKRLKIAFLSSFTANGFKETIFVKCCEIGVMPDIYVCGYGQHAQEILNKSSGFYRFDPDLVIFFLDARAVLQDYLINPYSMSAQKRKSYIDSRLNDIKSFLESIKERTKAKILVHNFEVPAYSPLGMIDNKQDFGLRESVERMNSDLRGFCKNDARVILLDYESFCSRIGKVNTTDFKMLYMGDIKLSMQFIPGLCDEYMGCIKALAGLSRKCIVLDLDNTLWGGIIGEEGISGIKLGNNPEGRPFMEFQKALLALHERGVILAINSKNNFDDAIGVFRKHPDMILKEANFASIRINWNDKVSNMVEIAKEINIGLDSIVFMDDDRLNCEIIRKALPEVKVIDMPDDSSLYLKTLMELNDFSTFAVTDEDRKRGSMYTSQRKRIELQKSAKGINSYLKSLGSVAIIRKADKVDVQRISQLTQKTNQFNMTAKRYSEEEIRNMSKDNKWLVVSLRSRDKFGDNGLVGVAIVKKSSSEWAIDSFLFSCRVIGRRIEESLLWYIMNAAKNKNVKLLKAYFIRTKKNEVAKDFYKANGFVMKHSRDGKEGWEYSLSRKYNAPDFIRILGK